MLAKDHLDLTEADRQIIRRKLESDPHSRIVITHGTATLIKTAVVREGIPGQAMGLTGSMQPARFRNNGWPNGRGNLARRQRYLAPPAGAMMRSRIMIFCQIFRERPLVRFSTSFTAESVTGSSKRWT